MTLHIDLGITTMLYDLQNNSDKLLDVVINDTDSSDGMSPSDQVKSLKGENTSKSVKKDEKM